MNDKNVERPKATLAQVLPTGEPEHGVCEHCSMQIVRYGGGIWHHITFQSGHGATPKVEANS